ncbi:tRNA (adenosine(37)-N6)-threonylcarbamoyltransferase complex ATPase subunit type 1 TsaE [Altererythrobacter lutimaris]|uniref:tRNA threonylcarbamoyladenosine biosynthesis protein TsaE n=1 Tax=Altererythrobacter lutimaris TaxID=2743979 RepID=A0A850H7V1_9SPHN|nr:tRNA (adenosine(37)-N6)-threonylcarbamoyltransferase complex ATPase subunit type 1 TsaE [Altererythrobacter lutimaris]NVE93610.1 tRNA (adenosine(37)-N6)-threonylcarbamoyltransferase complex ATPase subunit type 1 TsaE [Altererythrobacter lutimaris]
MNEVQSTIELPDLAAMAEFGARIAAQLQPGDVVELRGDLGAGKSTLARAVLAALGHKGDVPSPTFTLIELYDDAAMRMPVAHADFYRLDDAAEVLELGLDDYREGAALLAEWPEKGGGFAHELACLTIELEIAEQGRRAIVSGGKAWQGRMP